MKNVKTFLKTKGYECDFGKVKVQKPTEKLRARKRVAFPYVGPALHWLKPTQKVKLDAEKSKLEIDACCGKCSRTSYKFKMDGLVILEEELGNTQMFQIQQFGFSAATFLTENALETIKSADFTNFFYREVGIVETDNL